MSPRLICTDLGVSELSHSCEEFVALCKLLGQMGFVNVSTDFDKLRVYVYLKPVLEESKISKVPFPAPVLQIGGGGEGGSNYVLSFFYFNSFFFLAKTSIPI